jgi:hypothetical protein
MKVKFQIPASLNDIALSDYQEFQKILKANEGQEDSTFVQMKMLEIFCKADPDKLRQADISVFSFAVDELAKILERKPAYNKIIELDGQKFGFIPKIDAMTLGEYVDLESYISDPLTFHKALTILYRPITMEVKDTYLIEPYKGSDQYAEAMKEVGLSDALGAMLFFWTLGRELVEHTIASLVKESKTMTSEEDLSSQQNGDGINQLYISQMEMLLSSMKSQELMFINVCAN